MSIAFGVVLSLFTIGTATWAAAGHRLATVPSVARVLDYLDGGYNMPTERAVDELVAIAESRRAHGLRDRDEVMPNGQTFAEWIESSRLPNAVSQAAINATAQNKVDDSPIDGWRGWLRGGYNMPTEAEVTAAPPKTLRGAYLRKIPDGWIFADENPDAYLRSVGILDSLGGLPFPSREQHDADAARNGWGVP